MRKIVVMLGIALFLTACGSNFAPQETTGDIGSMSIRMSDTAVEAGKSVQLSLSIRLTTGEIIDGVKDVFTNPDTNEFFIVDWKTSNSSLARIDDYGMLDPQLEGYVTITALVGENERTRQIHVEGGRWRPIRLPSPDEVAEVEEDDDDWVYVPPPDDPIPDDPTPDDPTPCQGYAVTVHTFTPGAYAGFGSGDLPGIVLGPPQGNGDGAGSYDVVSLGEYGEIVLGFGGCELVDGPGEDFIVFENAFFSGGDPAAPFHEFGAVGVSEDGVNFTEFSCDESVYPFEGCAGVRPVYSNSVNGIDPFNAAIAGGDVFDLATIGIERARYVRIRDLGDRPAGGTIAGFDLDAISVVNGEQL